VTAALQLAVRREACVVKGVLTWVGLLLGVGGIIAFIYGLTILISNGNCGCNSDGFCSGPPCPPADDLGFLGLFAGIWVSIGGFILMGVARGHARAQQWRQQYAGGANSFANMSRAYGTGGGVPGLTLGALSSGSIAPGASPTAVSPANPELIAQLLKVRQENSGNPAAARDATLDLLRSHGYQIPANAPPGSVAVQLGSSTAAAGGPGFALPGAAPESAEAILARDAQTGLTGMSPPQGDAASRLQELDALKQQGVLNDDEYAAQRKRILDSI
jgi:Short C-terminal domain